MSYPYELLRVPGSQAVETLFELQAKGSGTPIILGDEERFEQIVECMKYNDGTTINQLVDAARQIDVVQWLAAREAADPENYEIEPDAWPEGEVEPNTTLVAHWDLVKNQPYPEVVLTVVPTTESWTVPCFLRIGGWNEVPYAQEHAALFKHWSEQFGATVACIAGDIIELTVARPASTREEALALARQQFIYCTDIVHQGVGSVEALAATLLGATVWYFWWD
jgi:hypothetical protein